jgi:hypothetical protein
LHCILRNLYVTAGVHRFWLALNHVRTVHVADRCDVSDLHIFNVFFL